MVTKNFAIYPAKPQKSTEISGLVITYEDNSEIEKYALRVNVLNKIARFYSMFGFALFFVGVASYLFLTVLFVISIYKKRLSKTVLESHLILTGLGLSPLVLIAGIAYTEMSCFTGTAIQTMYLAGAYPLLSAFEILSILFCAKFILQGIRNRHKVASI